MSESNKSDPADTSPIAKPQTFGNFDQVQELDKEHTEDEDSYFNR